MNEKLIIGVITALVLAGIGALGVFWIIAMRKKTEEKLIAKDRTIESIIQSSAVATFVINPEHKVIFWNKACEELTGKKAEDMIGTSNHWMAFYDHERPCVADLIIDNKFDSMGNFYKVYAKSTLVPEGFRAEGWYLKLGGKDRYIVFDAAPIYDADGKLIAAIETLQDITERKKTEEKLEEKNMEFEQMNKLMIGREKKMIELKKEIKELKGKSGEV